MGIYNCVYPIDIRFCQSKVRVWKVTETVHQHMAFLTWTVQPE